MNTINLFLQIHKNNIKYRNFDSSYFSKFIGLHGQEVGRWSKNAFFVHFQGKKCLRRGK